MLLLFTIVTFKRNSWNGKKTMFDIMSGALIFLSDVGDFISVYYIYLLIRFEIIFKDNLVIALSLGASDISQPAVTCSKLTIKTQEQGVK